MSKWSEEKEKNQRFDVLPFRRYGGSQSFSHRFFMDNNDLEEKPLNRTENNYNLNLKFNKIPFLFLQLGYF